MEHYLDIKYWLIQTINRVLSPTVATTILTEVARLEAEGARGEVIVAHMLEELHKKFYDAVKHRLAPEE